MELYEKGLCELLKLIESKKVSVAEVIESHISRSKKIDSILNAFEETDYNYILEEAKKIDKGFYKHSMSFKGIPIGVKDCYNTERMHTRRGSKIYKDYTAGNNARIVRKIVDEGALILGKTKTSEFAVHHPSDTVNPHNIKHTPGTSSGGSATAVASGQVPLAFGTQTAASTSKPASYCGVYGFKPTFGLFPRTGVLKTSDTLDTLSIFARNIEDIEYSFDKLRLKGEDYPYIYNNIDLKKHKSSIDDFKVALIISDTFNDKPQYAKDAFSSLEKELNSVTGIEAEIINIPDFLHNAKFVHEKIYNKSLSYYFKEEYLNYYELLSDTIKSMIEIGQKINLKNYLELLEKQKNLTTKFNHWINDNYDVVITLASASEAPKGLEYNDKADSTLTWTLVGVPTLIVPKFKSSNNLPFGFQIIGKKYSDYSIIEFAKKLKNYNIISDTKVI